MPTAPLQTTNFNFSTAEDGDIESLLALFRRSFHCERSAENWRWRYRQNPHGNRSATVARASDGEIVAHYAGYPVVIRDTARGHRLNVLQIGDIMTAAEFRGIGRGPTSLMARTTDQFYVDHCTGKVAFNYGFNAASSKGFSLRFMGAKEVEDAPLWSRPLPMMDGPKVRYRIRRISNLAPGTDDASAIDRFFERAAPHYGTLLERTSAWLRWRYLECPDEPGFELFAAYRWGRMVGWSVFKRPAGEALRWCDALTTPRHAGCAHFLIAAAVGSVSLAPKQGAQPLQEIQCWFSERPQWWAQRLRDLGFHRVDEPNGIGMVCVPHQEQEAVQLMRNAYYAWGDGDLA